MRDTAFVVLLSDGLGAERDDPLDVVDGLEVADELIVDGATVTRHGEIGRSEGVDLVDGEVLETGTRHGHEGHEEHTDQERVGRRGGAPRVTSDVVGGEASLEAERGNRRLEHPTRPERDHRTGQDDPDEEGERGDPQHPRRWRDQQPRSTTSDEHGNGDHSLLRERPALHGRLPQRLDRFDAARLTGGSHDREERDHRADHDALDHDGRRHGQSAAGEVDAEQ